MKKPSFTFMMFGVLGVAAWASNVGAADQPSAGSSKPAPAKTGTSLDDELFKDLDGGATPAAAKPKAAAPAVTSRLPGEAPQPTASKSSTPANQPAAGRPTGTAPSKLAPAKPLDPLDAELLKQLEGEDPPKAKPPTKPAGGVSGKPSAEPEGDSPLARLSRQVRDAEARLRRTDSGDETQELQRRIVQDLDQLIAQIEQQMQQSQSQSKGSPNSPRPGSRPSQQQQPGTQGNQPADDPNGSDERLVNRQEVKPDPAAMRELLEKKKLWGALPERDRQNIIQFSFEDFPVKYQFVIEEYFKTLLKRPD